MFSARGSTVDPSTDRRTLTVWIRTIIEQFTKNIENIALWTLAQCINNISYGQCAVSVAEY